jgi:2-hydroxy-3-oxopropionate reductase
MRENKMTDIGFIGLGIMGKPMAGHLQAAGHRLFVLEKSAAAKDLVAAGATACKSGKEIAEKASVVIIMVPDTPDVGSVLFSAGGVAEGLSKGKVVVDMSSISPIATKEFAKKVNAKGADYLDAPVSGGEVGAKAASLTIMVGGPQSAFDTVKPLFDKMGKNVTLIGGNGDGQTTKVANQIIVALTIEAVAEGLLFASRQAPIHAGPSGFDGRPCDIAHSRIARRAHDQADVQSGLPHRTAPEGPQPGTGRRRALGLSLPNTSTAQQLFNACVAHGGKAWDHSAMVKALETMANHEVARVNPALDK